MSLRDEARRPRYAPTSRNALGHPISSPSRTVDDPLYGIWSSMRARCYDPANSRYASYGGRGVTVCDQWLVSFETFKADLGPRPSAGHSIDRIDNDGNYEPANCRWATRSEQQRNTSRSRMLTADGRTLPLIAWAAETGLRAEQIRRRIDKYGWSEGRALTQPSRGGGK